LPLIVNGFQDCAQEPVQLELSGVSLSE